MAIPCHPRPHPISERVRRSTRLGRGVPWHCGGGESNAQPAQPGGQSRQSSPRHSVRTNTLLDVYSLFFPSLFLLFLIYFGRVVNSLLWHRASARPAPPPLDAQVRPWRGPAPPPLSPLALNTCSAGARSPLTTTRGAGGALPRRTWLGRGGDAGGDAGGDRTFKRNQHS